MIGCIASHKFKLLGEKWQKQCFLVKIHFFVNKDAFHLNRIYDDYFLGGRWKGQCHEIIAYFASKIRPGPHMNRQKWFRELFRFRGDILSQSSKLACPRSRWLRGHATFSLNIVRRFSYFYIIAIGCVNTSKYPFLPDSFFKIWEKLLKFFRKCRCSHCHVGVVNDYANTMSAWSTTTPISCPRSQG